MKNKKDTKTLKALDEMKLDFADHLAIMNEEMAVLSKETIDLVKHLQRSGLQMEKFIRKGYIRKYESVKTPEKRAISKEQLSHFKNTKLSVLHGFLSSRTNRALCEFFNDSHNTATISDLINTPRQTLLRQRRFGMLSLHELESFLANHGLEFKSDCQVKERQTVAVAHEHA